MPVEFLADLHLHTCLSPCAELTMTPKRIVERAASLGINILAVCDHNSCENAMVAEAVGRSKGITVFPGMEINSAEEVHVLGLFPDALHATRMQETVYAALAGVNDPETFGLQVVVNEDEEVLGFNDRLLIGATSLSVNRIVELIHEMNGVAIASHIDREGYGIVGQLGFIPPDSGFDALEISRSLDYPSACERFPEYRGYPWITSSDAHCLEDVGRRPLRLTMEHATFEEFRLALRGREGRSIFF